MGAKAKTNNITTTVPMMNAQVPMANDGKIDGLPKYASRYRNLPHARCRVSHSDVALTRHAEPDAQCSGCASWIHDEALIGRCKNGAGQTCTYWGCAEHMIKLPGYVSSQHEVI